MKHSKQRHDHKHQTIDLVCNAGARQPSNPPAPEAVAELKAQPGKPILVFGSADFAATLMQHNFIDEYRIAVNPVILSEGTPLFKGYTGRRELRLIETRIFTSGIVELRYAPGHVE
jgi:dihydrofolate reductase